MLVYSARSYIARLKKEHRETSNAKIVALIVDEKEAPWILTLADAINNDFLNPLSAGSIIHHR